MASVRLLATGLSSVARLMLGQSRRNLSRRGTIQISPIPDGISTQTTRGGRRRLRNVRIEPIKFAEQVAAARGVGLSFQVNVILRVVRFSNRAPSHMYSFVVIGNHTSHRQFPFWRRRILLFRPVGKVVVCFARIDATNGLVFVVQR
jgi:hypothetical protein